jgi:hypothetical protein
VPEKAKRLEPSPEVKRHLFLLSGNQCAFEGCYQPIIDQNGTYVATLCHIEAALPGGERFNPGSNNRERASFDNLMLMCERHHRVTDDVDAFPVARMREIKRRHEEKFSEGVRRFLADIEDETRTINPRPAVTLEAFCRVCGYEVDGLEARTHLSDLRELTAVLARLSRPARQLLVVLVRHGRRDGDSLRISMQHVLDVTGLAYDSLAPRVAQLGVQRLAWIDDDDFYESASGAPFVVVQSSQPQDWPNVLADLRDVSESLGVPLERLLEDLDFTTLD